MKNTSLYLCIEGNIGAGKTTLARELAQRMKAEYLPERFEENVLLSLFYEKPKTYAFPTEYAFLIDRHKQLYEYFHRSGRRATVADFHFDKCLCFAKANLRPEDFLFYRKHFAAMKQTLPSPDLIVYLDTSTEQLQRNIRHRGREAEKHLKKSYLKKIQKSLDSYYLRKKRTAGLLLHLQLEEYTVETLDASCLKIIDTLKARGLYKS